MRGLDDFDALARHGVAVARDDQARQRAWTLRFDGACHRRRRLAGADDDEPPRALFPQHAKVRCDAALGLRRRDCRVEHAPQQLRRLHAAF